MATTYYYVDGTNGDNAHGGHSPDDAFLTLAGLLAHGVVADSEIWVAPGTYKETLTLATSGTDATTNSIRWYGDVNCTKAWASNVAQINPGRVRITLADANNLPQAGKVLDFNAKAYNYFYDFVFDGVLYANTSSNIVVDGDLSTSGQKLFRCLVIGGYYGTYRIDAEECVVISPGAPAAGASGKSYIKCAFIGGGSSTGTFNECFVIGRDGSCLSSADIQNCTLLGGASAIYNPVAKADNCLIIGSTYLYRDSQGTKVPPSGCFCIATNDAYSGQGSDQDLSSNRQIYISVENAATPCADGEIFLFPPPLTMIRHLAAAFKISGWGDFDMADGSDATTEALDIEGQARTAYGVKHIGWQAVSNVTIEDDSTNGNTIRINREGEVVLYMFLKASVAATVTIDCDWSLDSGSEYPRIQLEDTHTDTVTLAFSSAEDYATTGTSDTFSVSVTPTRDCMARLRLRAMENNTNAYAEFHSLAVT